MKTIAYAEFLKFVPYCSYTQNKKALIDSIARRRGLWNALEILSIEEIPSDDRLYIVCREKLIDAPFLHEFACRCADRALSRIEKSNPNIVELINIKRLWSNGLATDEDLNTARNAVKCAERNRAWDVVWCASDKSARDAAWGASHSLAWDAVCSMQKKPARAAAWAAERQWQIAELKRLLMEQKVKSCHETFTGPCLV